jgi:hypothetical protein
MFAIILIRVEMRLRQGTNGIAMVFGERIRLSLLLSRMFFGLAACSLGLVVMQVDVFSNELRDNRMNDDHKS